MKFSVEVEALHELHAVLASVDKHRAAAVIVLVGGIVIVCLLVCAVLLLK